MSLVDYEYADLIDDQDKVRMLIDPTSTYAQAAASAMGVRWMMRLSQPQLVLRLLVKQVQHLLHCHLDNRLHMVVLT